MRVQVGNPPRSRHRLVRERVGNPNRSAGAASSPRSYAGARPEPVTRPAHARTPSATPTVTDVPARQLLLTVVFVVGQGVGGAAGAVGEEELGEGGGVGCDSSRGALDLLGRGDSAEQILNLSHHSAS